MYTIAETFAETENKALAVPGSYQFVGDVTGRCAIIWTAYAEKHGMDWLQTVVRFFDAYEWVDTRYPIDTAAAERLAQDWAAEKLQLEVILG